MIDNAYKKGRTVKERLEDLSQYVTESGCQLWLGATNKDGYGEMQVRGKRSTAHRVSYAEHRGLPTKPIIGHLCNTPSCINPNHLREMTQSDNIQQMYDSGRGRPSLRCVSREELNLILSSTESHTKLAEQFGVHRKTIARLRKAYA